jgi:hypothetical protein
MSIATVCTLSRHCCVRAASQDPASLLERPFGLPQQALIPSQVNESGVPPVSDLLEHLRLGVHGEAWFTPAGLVDPQRHHRFAARGEHRGGVVNERCVHHRPGQGLPL